MAEETGGTQPTAEQGADRGTFVLGLTMAGAVSGGAYTAGALSFLAEALDAWERCRGQPGVPDHRVVLKAISGASAGSICGALGAISLLERPGPATHGLTTKGEKVEIPRALPRLFAAWVHGPCLVNPDRTEADLLGMRDLKKGGPVVSLLDSTRLDDVAMAGVGTMPQAEAWRPWVDPRLHLHMTHTDMRGVPYRVTFAGGLADGDHGMLSHADRVHYVLKAGAAEPPVPDNAWLAAEGAIDLVLDLPALLRRPGTPEELLTLKEATLASSAFPVGFTARHLRHDLGRRRLRPLPIARRRANGEDSWVTLEARWDGYEPWPGNPARTTVWDGGCLDNEPFQYARWAIMAAPPLRNPRDGEDTDRAVLMIDPFPEPPGMPGWGTDGPDPALLAVLQRALGVFVNAARFKPEEVAAALDRSIYSRFLLAPQREELQGGRALASGGLGGFGGTIAEAFRLHDFQLGRRNCQHFLRRHFVVPDGNRTVGTTALPADPKLRPRPGHKPVIPLCDGLDAEIPTLAWPRISAEKELAELVDRARLRVDAVVARLIGGLDGAAQRLAAKLAWQVFARQAAHERIGWILFRELLARDQITGWTEHGLGLEQADDTERAVLWLLADPAFDAWTEAALAGLLRSAPLLHPRGEAPDLAAALSRMQALGWIETLPGRPRIWTLRKRAPGALALALGRVMVRKG